MEKKSIFNQRLASIWSEFVDCPERLKTLGFFLEKYLSKHKEGLIFDAALGIGCESIFLKKKGFRIISNEIDNTLIQIANKFAHQQGIQLEVTKQDWKELKFQNSSNYFQGIINLGNSISLLNNLDDIRLAIKNFYNALEVGGTLIIDERNFTYILEHKTEILSGNFRYSGKYIYCGKSIKGIPVNISNEEITFGYFKGKNLLGLLRMYPFKKKELYRLLLECGFKNVNEFSDFKIGYNEYADFFMYVATK